MACSSSWVRIGVFKIALLSLLALVNVRITIKITLFNLYYGTLYTTSFWCNKKKQCLKDFTVAYVTTFLECCTTCYTVIVQVIRILVYQTNGHDSCSVHCYFIISAILFMLVGNIKKN